MWEIISWAIERTEGASGFYVGQALGELGIDDAALRGRVFLVGVRQLRTDADDAAGHPEFDLLATLN
jgi:hypothetical protein